MNTSGMITKPDMRNLLNLPQDDMVEALQRTGAMNAQPPLVRSSHLKNKVTGLVLPWNPLIAEQRDIMENCDANGNTDPSAWEGTVDMREYTEADRDADYWAARESVVQQAMQMTDGYAHSLQTSEIPKRNRHVPDDVQTYESFSPLQQNSSLGSGDRLAKQMDFLNQALEF